MTHEAIARRRMAGRARIEAALARLNEGDWSWRTACGNAIAKKRLAHDPSVAKCVECAG